MKRNQWTALSEAEDIWVGQYLVPNFASNSIAVKLAEDHWLLISPGEGLLDDWNKHWPDYAGRMSILMPNGYHFMGVAAWQEAFPQASLYASQKASKRLCKKGVEGVLALEKHALALPSGMEIWVPPGHRAGDAWLIIKRKNTCIWITCDSFLNYDRLSNQPIARALQRMLGTAPGLRIGEVIRWLILDSRASFKRWVLERLATQPPNILIPSHGEIYRGEDLSERLMNLVKQRL